ncbi:MAG: transposase [Muribaculaceae bacterium]|nr:transposase [Muribaculaceae bacterium]
MSVVECVKSNSGTSEFRPISGRWVVERTNAWLECYRRLCRNYERYLSTARAMTYFASILFMLRYG